MNHASLFSGIGAAEYASKIMGWENVFHCEINEFCNKVLKYHYPDSIEHNDIKTTDFSIYRGKIDILTGGFPCQPYSVAGKRKGKEDERHLWPEMLRAIRGIQPTWIVGENVSGLISWNGGLVFHEVQTDLEAEGYEVQPVVLPAAGVNAPHRRDRVFIIAYSNNKRRSSGSGEVSKEDGEISEWNKSSKFGNAGFGAFTNTSIRNGRRIRRSETYLRGEIEKQSIDSHISSNGIITNANSRRQPLKEYWHNFPTQSPICSRNDEFPDRLSGITFSKWRNESIKALGNSIVPQVLLQIFKAIEEFENL